KGKGECIPGCFICEDSGHTAENCHHNPLLLARSYAQATKIWCCYHCGFVAHNDEEAREHFGPDDQSEAACAAALRQKLEEAERVRDNAIRHTERQHKAADQYAALATAIEKKLEEAERERDRYRKLADTRDDL